MTIIYQEYLQLRGRLKSAKYEAFKLKSNGGVLEIR